MFGPYDSLSQRLASPHMIAFAVALVIAVCKRAAYPRPSRLAVAGFGLLFFSNLAMEVMQALIIATRGNDGPSFFISGQMAMWFLTISRTFATVFLVKAIYVERKELQWESMTGIEWLEDTSPVLQLSLPSPGASHPQDDDSL